MKFLNQSIKTSWKFFGVVILVAALAAGTFAGYLWWQEMSSFTVTGTAKDWISERPLANMEITVGEKSVQTDAEGSFQLKQRELPNIHTVSVAGFYPREIALTGTPESFKQRTVPLDEIVLTPKGRFLFEATKRGEKPVLSLFSARYDGTDIKEVMELGSVGTSLSPLWDKLALLELSKEGLFHKWFLRVKKLPNGEEESVYRPQIPISVPIGGLYSPPFRRGLIEWSAGEEALLWAGRETDLVTGKSGTMLLYVDLQNREISPIPNPLTGDQFFQGIANFRISPNGKWVAFIAGERNERGRKEQGVFLYNAQADATKLLFFADSASGLYVGEGGLFFDENNNLYFSTIAESAQFGGPNQWRVYDTSSERETVKEEKPTFWEKMQEARFANTSSRIFHLCERDEESLCMSETKEVLEQELLRFEQIGIQRNEVWKLLLSADDRFLFVEKFSDSLYPKAWVIRIEDRAVREIPLAL